MELPLEIRQCESLPIDAPGHPTGFRPGPVTPRADEGMKIDRGQAGQGEHDRVGSNKAIDLNLLSWIRRIRERVEVVDVQLVGAGCPVVVAPIGNKPTTSLRQRDQVFQLGRREDAGGRRHPDSVVRSEKVQKRDARARRR